MLTNLVQLRRDDITPGAPLRFPVFDQESCLVLAEGQLVDTAARVEELIQKGAYRTPAIEERGSLPVAVMPAQSGVSQECTFEDIRLNIGDALQLQTFSGNDRHYVKLIGYIPEASVLITTPMLGGRVLLMREGQAFVVRAFSGRAAYAFNTAITKVCNVPYPYLHLQFPKRVEGVAVRREARVQARVIASVTRDSVPGEPVPAVIGDLSPSGARVDARERLANKGERLSVSFRLRYEQDDAYFVIEAIVRSVREDRRSDETGDLVFMHGIEFIGTQPNERLLLRAIILQRLAENRRDDPASE